MADENVRVASSDEYSQQEIAVLLLAAVEELGLPAGAVTVDTTTSSGSGLSAPKEAVKKAGLEEEKDESEDVSDELEGPTAEFFRNAKKGDPKPEQQVAGDNRPGATTDDGSGRAMGDGQAGEAEATRRAAARAEADKNAEKKAPAKKAAAKKTAAKKS